MFGSLGAGEIVLIAIVALIVIGPAKLPEVARTVGKGLSEFRRASNDLRWQVMSTLEEENAPPRPPPLKQGPTLRRPEGTTAVGAAEPPAAPAATDKPPHE